MAAPVAKALMQISATGTWTRLTPVGTRGQSNPMNLRGHVRGFSLIELLVVIAIIGIVVSMALLSLGILGDDRQLQTEARRVMALIEVAEDDATMQGRDFGIEFMQTGYRFVEWDPFTDRWTELLGDDTLRLRELPDDAEFDLFLEDKRVLLERDPQAFEDPEDNGPVGLVETYAPHLFLFSSGDTAPFELHIFNDRNDQVVVIQRDELGNMEIVADEG